MGMAQTSWPERPPIIPAWEDFQAQADEVLEAVFRERIKGIGERHQAAVWKAFHDVLMRHGVTVERVAQFIHAGVIRGFQPELQADRVREYLLKTFVWN